MWDRKFESASWNGETFNILKTNTDRGKRLQVSELPYSDDPHIWVLGGKAIGYQIDAVFVGDDSLIKAELFQAKLDADPAGQLEHPYLGELDLVYQDSSISFVNTKKGLVSVTLKFIKQGSTVVIPESLSKGITTYTQPVVVESTNNFATTIEQSSPDQVTTIKQEFADLLSKISLISGQMNKPGTDVTDLAKSITNSKSAISSMTNSPSAFLNQINSTMTGLVNQINQSDSASSTLVVNSNTYAQNKLKSVEQSSTLEHVKTLTTIASIETNQSIAALSKNTIWPLNITYTDADINSLIDRLNNRMIEATVEATYDRYEQVSALENLTVEVGKYHKQIKSILSTLIEEDIYSPTPTLTLAQTYEQDLNEMEALNNFKHPLFVTGKVLITNE